MVDGKVAYGDLVSRKKLQDMFEVGASTIKRWATFHEWNVIRIGKNAKNIYYPKKEVENSLGILVDSDSGI